MQTCTHAMAICRLGEAEWLSRMSPLRLLTAGSLFGCRLVGNDRKLGRLLLLLMCPEADVVTVGRCLLIPKATQLETGWGAIFSNLLLGLHARMVETAPTLALDPKFGMEAFNTTRPDRLLTEKSTFRDSYRSQNSLVVDIYSILLNQMQSVCSLAGKLVGSCSTLLIRYKARTESARSTNLMQHANSPSSKLVSPCNLYFVHSHSHCDY